MHCKLFPSRKLWEFYEEIRLSEDFDFWFSNKLISKRVLFQMKLNGLARIPIKNDLLCLVNTYGKSNIHDTLAEYFPDYNVFLIESSSLIKSLSMDERMKYWATVTADNYQYSRAFDYFEIVGFN